MMEDTVDFTICDILVLGINNNNNLLHVYI